MASRYIYNILPEHIPALQKYINDLEKVAGMEYTYTNPREHVRAQSMQLKKRAYQIFKERSGSLEPECPKVKYTLTKKGFHRVCHVYPKRPKSTTLDDCMNCKVWHKFIEILEKEVKRKDDLGLKSF